MSKDFQFDWAVDFKAKPKPPMCVEIDAPTVMPTIAPSQTTSQEDLWERHWARQIMYGGPYIKPSMVAI